MGDFLGGQLDDSSCYKDGFIIYKEIEKKDFFLKGIDRIKTAFKKGLKIVLMCSEKKPQECHRSKLLGVHLEKIKIHINHVDENYNTVSQEEVIRRLNHGQQSFFETDFKSRRKLPLNP